MNYKIIKFSIIAFFMVLFVISCGESYKEKTENEKQEREKQIELYNIKLNNVIEPLENHYNPKLFPPEMYQNKILFTCNLESYLIDESKTPISFHGVLTDITKDDSNQYYIHFITKLKSDTLHDELIKFRLSCNYNDVKDIIDNPPKEDFFGTKYFDPNYYVVCEVFFLDKIYFYEITGTQEDQDTVEIDIQTPHTYSIKGKLIEFEKYPER